MRYALLAIALLASLVLLLAPASDVHASSSVMGGVERVFAHVERLSEEGVNVSRAVGLLNSALEKAYACPPGNAACLGEARGYLAKAERVVGELEAGAPAEIAWRNARMYATLAGLALIPVASYLGIPRVWAWAWARSRRKWLVAGRRRKH